MIDRTSLLSGHVAYLACLTAVMLALPPIVWEPGNRDFLFAIGALAIWRYSWGGVHLVRYLIYRLVVFPRWRRRADALAVSMQPPHVYLLVTSFRIGTETSRRVYASVFEEAIRYTGRTTIVASIVEVADQRLIKALFEHLCPPPTVKLVFVRIAGTGKRDALASGFRVISLQQPPPGALAAVIDGDSMLEPGCIERCAPFFELFPRVGALTTDEVCEVEGSRFFREWYGMRFAQRNILMGSVGLSRRVLTLTGRMSMFRAALLTEPSFIEQVERDWIDHWRLGRVKFLTGDDKSSWFWLLKNGYEMLYIPDAKINTIETPPDSRFIRSSIILMHRWFGNMLRTNARAIALGPKRMGLFTWWCIVDQRLSMWTTLTGPMVALLLTVSLTPAAFFYYIVWVAFTRYVQTLSLLVSRRQVSALYPFLLYYNQIVGSFIKTKVLYRLDRQKWTRQNTTLQVSVSSMREMFFAVSSSYMRVLSFAVFISALAVSTKILHAADWRYWMGLIGG